MIHKYLRKSFIRTSALARQRVRRDNNNMLQPCKNEKKRKVPNYGVKWPDWVVAKLGVRF
jgi:hypothetical protein